MENKGFPASPEPKKPLTPRRVLGLAALALSTAACKATDIFGSSDQVSCFARGFIGTEALILELGGGKLFHHAMHEAKSMGTALAELSLFVIPPLAVGGFSALNPDIGPIVSYVSFYLPIVAGVIHLIGRR